MNIAETMLRLSFLLSFMLFISYLIQGQNKTNYDPPTNVRFDDEHLPWQVDLEWTPPQGWIHSSEDKWYEWDKGINTGELGSGFIPAEAAARWDANQLNMYDTVYLTKIKYFLLQPLVDYKLMVYQGNPESFDTLLDYPLNDYLNYNEFDTITLSPILLDPSKDLWIGYWVSSLAPAKPLPLGCYPAIDGYGNMIKLGENGIWTTLYSLSTNAFQNWNIGGYLETPNDTIIYPLFNVYRSIDGLPFALINQECIQDTVFYDFVDNINPSHLYYYITCVYEDGESEPSDTLHISFVNSKEYVRPDPIKIFPNPATDNVSIESAGGRINSVTLIDSRGNVLINKNVEGININLDVSYLRSSIYIIKVVTSGSIYTSKLIIKR